MGDSSPEYDPEYARIAAEVRAELKELGEDEQNSFSDDDDPADRGWSTYVTDAKAFFAGRRIKPKAWRFYYDRGLCARLALYCYNLQKGTVYDFWFISQLHEQTHRSFTKSFITFEAVNPAHHSSPITFETCVKHIDDQVTHVPNLWWETHICRVEGSEEADYEWDDGAVNDCYKGEMPKWLSDEDQQRCYVVKQSELHDQKNGWLTLLTEFAFFTKWNGPLSPGEIEDCRPLITQEVVVETLDEEAEKEQSSDKVINAANAIFYISFECVEDPTKGRYRAVVRKTMDGKPGHMRLEHRHTVPAISDDFYNYMKLINKTDPEIMSKLLPILRTIPDSGIQLSRREKITLDKQYAVLQYDEEHEIVWAVIAAKLLSIVKHRPESILTDYSAQYMLDFAPRPKKAQIKHQRTCCKPLSVLDGLRYGLKNNLPREQDWKYAGCRDIRKPRGVSLVRMVGDLRPTKRLSAALSALRMIPVAARLHIFEPDVDLVGNEIYRGPKYFESKYEGQRDVMIYATKIVKEELVAVVNFPFKRLKELHVSLDVMLVQTPREDETNDPFEELENPTCLLTKFCILL
ncbi:unnamed protein product [Brassica oleracea]